jgi:hypothetical protein
MVNNLVGGIIPPQPPIEAQTDAHTLKSRLEWGEPAFTILDVRDIAQPSTKVTLWEQCQCQQMSW